MRALLLLLGGLFGSAASMFAAWMSKKTMLGLAMVTTYGVLTAAITASMVLMIAAAKSSAIGFGGLPASVVTGMGYFMPDNFSVCIALCISARVQVSVYLWNYNNLRIFGAA